jgi:hypothetical protein
MEADERACEKCGEGTATLREPPVCRDCMIGELIDSARCDECQEVIWNENALYVGQQPFGHAETCKSGVSERTYGLGLARGWTMALRPSTPPPELDP